MHEAKRGRIGAVFFLLFVANAIALPAYYYYSDDEMGSITLIVSDSHGMPAPGVRVYMTDGEWQYENIMETDAGGRIVIPSLHASPYHSYEFHSFIDGYPIMNGTKGIEPRENRIIELRPDPENRQNLSIEVTGDCVFPCSNKLAFLIKDDGKGFGRLGYAEVLAYDGNGRQITDFCDSISGYHVSLNRTWGWSPWLGYGYILGRLTESQREWLDERTGEPCLGDLEDIGSVCGYRSYDNPIERREESAYKPACPVGGVHDFSRHGKEFLNVISLPENAERAVIRAIGIDADGDYRIVEKELARKQFSRFQDWPCCACLVASGLLLAVAIGSAASRVCRICYTGL